MDLSCRMPLRLRKSSSFTRPSALDHSRFAYLFAQVPPPDVPDRRLDRTQLEVQQRCQTRGRSRIHFACINVLNQTLDGFAYGVKRNRQS